MSMTCLVIPKTWFMKVRFHSCYLTLTKHMNRLTGLKEAFPYHQLYISGKSCACIATTLSKGEHQVRCLTYEVGHYMVLDSWNLSIQAWRLLPFTTNMSFLKWYTLLIAIYIYFVRSLKFSRQSAYQWIRIVKPFKAIHAHEQGQKYISIYNN